MTKSFPRYLPIAAAFLWAVVVQAGEWVEVCAPGRPGGLLGMGSETGAKQAVVDLVPFDGRLYVSLLPLVADDGRVSILSYRHEELEVVIEVEDAARRLGRVRVFGDTIYVPLLEGRSGYYQRPSGEEWTFVPVEHGMQISDVAVFGGRIFLAGRKEDSALLMWREEGTSDWHVEDVNKQAARFSYRADTFLVAPAYMSLLLVRDVLGEWPRKTAPPDWGAWYLLHYMPQRSARGFLFDGQARPLPVLRALCPGSQMHNNTAFGVANDTPWENGLLYVVLSDDGLMRDKTGSLFHAVLREGTPQEGHTFFAQRLPGTKLARDVAVADGVCWALLAENTQPSGKVVTSRNLENWKTVFDGGFDSASVCLAVMDGAAFVGLDDGSVVMVNE